MAERSVGVLGAKSLVGECLVPLLRGNGWRVVEFSRRSPALPAAEALPFWISLAPIWALPDLAQRMEGHAVRRIVALSSTSRFSKQDSPQRKERETARRLAEGEAWLAAWAASQGAAWVVLRPTLIYGRGRDRNIAEIARFIRRFGFFPLVGKAGGLRQPVHAEDVAQACAAALEAPSAAGRAYNLSGGEVLTYREMVGRIFSALDRKPKLITLPIGLLALALPIARLWPRYREWNPAMLARMNGDLVFDHAQARRDLRFAPRNFALAPWDVGGKEGREKAAIGLDLP